MTSPAIVPLLTGGVLVVSPNSALREQVRRSLHDRSGPVQEASGGADALVKLESGEWQLLFLDRRLPDLDPEEVIQIIKVRFPETEVVMVDSAGGAPLSPSSVHRFRSWLKVAKPASQPARDELQTGLPAVPTSVSVSALPGMIGASGKMKRLYQMARLVAPRNTTVLILGATGTGKELVARAIHQLSSRSAGPFLVVNCAAIPETLLESELFGYIRKPFTPEQVKEHVVPLLEDRK